MNELCVLYALILSLCLTQITCSSVDVNINEIAADKQSNSHVDKNDKKTISEENMGRLAVWTQINENMRNIQKFRCKQPRTKVVSLKSWFNETNRSYIPSCVVLHVCDDESGCCNSESHKCVPKRRGSFQLFFLVSVGFNKQEPHRFTFPNDTECECREKMSRPRASTDVKQVERERAEESLCENPSMVCPKPFIPRPFTFKKPYKCRCDCAPDDHECHRIKKGKEPLSPEQQRCVTLGHCKRPVCGPDLEYDTWLGLCRNSHRKESIRHSHHYNRLSHYRNRH